MLQLIWKTKENIFFFSVGFNPIDTDDNLDIHKYLIKKNNIKFFWVT